MLVFNVMTLRERSHAEADRESATRQTIIAAEWLIANGERIIGDQPEPMYDPDITVQSLPWLVEHGLPVDQLTPTGLASARLSLQIDLDPQGASLPDGTPPSIEDLSDASVTGEQSNVPGVRCVQIAATGADPRLTVIAPGGRTTFSVSSDAGGPFAVALEPDPAAGQRVAGLQPGETRYLQTTLPAGTPIRLTLAMPESVVCGVG